MMHIKLWVLLLSMSLLTACSKEEAGTEAPGEPTKEICFSLNAGDAIGLSPARAAASIDGMSWKLLCFSDEYQYLFEATGTVSADEVKVQVPKGQAFRFLMLFAADAAALPSLEAGSSYWDLPAYAPQLPLSDPMSLLVGKGEEDGTIRVSASATKVAVALSPRAVKVTLQADASVADGTSVEGITFSTPTIEGTIMRRNKLDGMNKHPWKAEVTEGETGVSAETIDNWYQSVYEPIYSA